MPATRLALKRKQREFDDAESKEVVVRADAKGKYKGRPGPLHDLVLGDEESVGRTEALRNLKMEDVIDRLHVAKREWESCDMGDASSEEERGTEAEDGEQGQQEPEKSQDFFDTKERASVSGWRDPVLRDFGFVESMPARQRLKKSLRAKDKIEWGAGGSLTRTREQQGKTGNAAFRESRREAKAGAGDLDAELIEKGDSGKQKRSADALEELGPESEEEEDYSVRPLHDHISTISLDSDPEPSDGDSEGTDLLWSYPIGHRITEQTYPSEADFDVDGGANYEDADDEWDSEEEEDAKVAQREPPSEEEVLHRFKGSPLRLAVFNASRENLIKRIIREGWFRHEESVGLLR
ncbi:hypothetical protein PLEOSDRAFT_169213 [Pleurotus ostreatus PC15]|uniref:Uncharacterized protein n=1 Tax=Pleurotus ostreatus (strain PC15) TaxID=1137138 RepID=A0A067NEU6_PLEO1|nr:hypothetical protein PLEOSDRAFT_169213 [Pleurotus ostreatus PC15]